MDLEINAEYTESRQSRNGIDYISKKSIQTDRGTDKMKKTFAYAVLVVVTAGGLFGLNQWDEYREKDLADVMEAEEIVEVRYGTDDKSERSEVLNDEQSLQAFKDFLGQYRVEKEGPRDFTSKYPEEQFSFQLEYEDERITLPILIERDIILIELDQYKVTNGPIDHDRFEEFLKQF